MKQKTFEEKDKENLVKLLNMMHSKIQNLDGKEALEYHKLLSWAQQILLKKINDNIMGEMKVHEIPEEKSEKPKAKKAKK